MEFIIIIIINEVHRVPYKITLLSLFKLEHRSGRCKSAENSENYFYKENIYSDEERNN